MWRRSGAALLLVVVSGTGCSEYDVRGEVAFDGVANPKALPDVVNVDRILQTTVPEVDILFVVDNSCSMSDNQAALAENFPSFMEYFLDSGLDYHIGVISTDMDDEAHRGKLRETPTGARWIDPETDDALTAFSEMARMGSGGSPDEKGREATYMAVEILREAHNEGFLREDASLHTTIITDENDSSQREPISKEEFVAYLNDLRPLDEMVSFNSICNPPSEGFPPDVDAGTEYIFVTEGVGGLLRNIREQNWPSLLEDLGLQAAGLRREYFLSRLPVVDTLQVTVTDAGVVYEFAADVDWTYSEVRNSITFLEYVPDQLAEIEITYTELTSYVGSM